MWHAAKDHSKINEGEVKEKIWSVSQVGQDVALSRLRQGFEPPTDYHFPESRPHSMGDLQGVNR